MIWVSSLDYFSTEALTISASVSMILIKIWYLLKSTLNYLQLKTNKPCLRDMNYMIDNAILWVVLLDLAESWRAPLKLVLVKTKNKH